MEPDERDVIVGQLVVGIQDHVERYDANLLPALIRGCPLAESRRVGELLRAGLQAVRERSRSATARSANRPTRRALPRSRTIGGSGGCFTTITALSPTSRAPITAVTPPDTERLTRNAADAQRLACLRR